MGEASTQAFPLLERDHRVGGIFVKEVSPAPPGGVPAPILMVHGASHGWWAWGLWPAFFAGAGYRTFALSLPNHGDSDAVPLERYLRFTVDDYAAEVVRVIDWIGSPAVLLGHSMGGIVAQRAAQRRTLAALVLVCSVRPGQLGKMRDPLPMQRTDLPTAQEARSAWFHRIDDAAFAAFYARVVGESPGVKNDYGGGKLHVDPADVTAPVLTVGAEHDKTPVHAAARVAAFYGGDCLVVPGAGHDVMLEERSFDAAISVGRWLAKKLPGPLAEPAAGAEAGLG